MDARWFRDAIIYQADVALYADSDGDGWGDLCGMEERLEHMRGLGATACWLSPFYRSPYRDGGYDITDHLTVDERFGDLADFARLVSRAESLGIRILVELVVQHTSDQHPWFQEARRDRNSPYRDYYVWADEPQDSELQPVFPDTEDSIWTWDEEAGQYYRHCFYRHEPDLDLGNPRVREEMYRIIEFWLRMGVSGFRVDAVPYMVERARAADPRDDGLWLLNDMRSFVEQRSAGLVLLGEVDIPPKEYDQYLGNDDRLNLLLDFWLNNHLFLALAREHAGPLAKALTEHVVPPGSTVPFIRNHDELDLEQLSAEDRNLVLDRFAPDQNMRIYNRGIRRRLAPMLDGDERRLAMTHAVLMSLPGPPVMRYGDEIGMGDDLSRTERESVRTPMQWSDGVNGGFSAADPADLAAAVVTGRYGPDRVNVYEQLARPGSLLSRVGDVARSRAGADEIGSGECHALDPGAPSVLCLDHQTDGRRVITAVNLADEPATCRLTDLGRDQLMGILADANYERRDDPDDGFALGPHGYRWFRVRTERDR